jgi:hypothetical protein
MKERVDEEIVRYLWWLQPVLSDDPQPPGRPATRRPAPRPPAPHRSSLILNDPAAEATAAFAGARAQQAQSDPFGAPARKQPPRVGGDDAAVKPVRRDEPKVGRNDPCPCGSGKKYKKCHGAAA